MREMGCAFYSIVLSAKNVYFLLTFMVARENYKKQ